MTSIDTDKLVEEARLAVDHARAVRELHRRATRRGNKQREQDIDLALTRLKQAMRPIRSLISRFPYEPDSVIAEDARTAVYAASEAIQAERRKLWKMAHPKTRKKRAARRRG